MALRPLVALSLLTLAALAGCSDGPAKGDLVAIAGTPAIEGTIQSNYTAEVRPYPNPLPGGEPPCAPPQAPPPAEQCVEPSSEFTVHMMSLPEPDGNGYAIYLVGGSIGERQLVSLNSEGAGMYGATTSDDEDLSTQFERFELRMGDFVVATAPKDEGSQAFSATPALSAVTVTGSYNGRTLTVDVQGLPGDGPYVGRLYKEGTSPGNLTAVESFPIVAGAQEFEVKEAGSVDDYVEFHIHVGNSKIYLYQATIG